MKIAIVSPVFKTGDTMDFNNYRPISVPPCFSKIIEHAMHNRLYKYLTDKKMLHPQQFGFRKGHSAEHASAQLVDQIYKSFENDNYTVGVSYSRSYNTFEKARDLWNYRSKYCLIKKLLDKQKKSTFALIMTTRRMSRK